MAQRAGPWMINSGNSPVNVPKLQPKRKKKTVPEPPGKSARCEEHVRKHEKCPFDCPRRKCDYHTESNEICPPGCVHKIEELAKKREIHKQLLEQFLQEEMETRIPSPNLVSVPSSSSNIHVPVIDRVASDLSMNRSVSFQQFVPHVPCGYSGQEDLVPIRIDLTADNSRKIFDTITWNIGDSSVTPEQFAEVFCSDFDLPEKYESFIASTIRRQIQEYGIVYRAPTDENICLIKLDITINGIVLCDQFEWDISNAQNNPEAFARSLCADLGLSREFEVSISQSIREQVVFYKKAMARNRLGDLAGFVRPIPVQRAVRKEIELPLWTPFVSVVQEKMRNPQRFVDQHFACSPYAFLKKPKKIPEAKRQKIEENEQFEPLVDQ